MLDKELIIEHNTENTSVNDSGRDSLPHQESLSSGKKAKPSPFLEECLICLGSQETVEAKIECALSFMEKAIAQEKSADFKGFWDVRMHCLELFKENVSPFLRPQLWSKFSDLSKEARRLKDVLDEQSHFAAEQIDIAITAIESGLDQSAQEMEKEPVLDLDPHAYALKANLSFYKTAQAELNQLNLFASRITSLRKELIKTEMRIRTKNKFFERMSKAGDRVFPRRKGLIQEISQTFSKDIEQFIQMHFGSTASRLSIFDLREEIKALQSAAKLLTLNTQSFGKTRLALSECWDKLKEKDKERKEEFDKKKEIFQKNCEQLKALLDESLNKFDGEQLNVCQALLFLEGFNTEMRAKELGRDEVKALREQALSYREKVEAKQKMQEEERQKHELLRMQQKKALFDQFFLKCQTLLEKAKELSAEDLIQERDLILEEIQKSGLGKFEKNELDKSLKSLKDILRKKREEALLTLPEDERLALEQLKILLAEKLEHRQEIKERMEHYRKLLGSSGLSFEKSMDYNARASEEKEAYEQAQIAVRDIEMKIEKLETIPL